MLTRLKLKRGEGKLVVTSAQVRSRIRRASLPQAPPQMLPQISVEASASMSHEGRIDNMLDDENSFRKAFFDMTEMVKVLCEERTSRLQGESSKPSKGEGYYGGKGGDDEKP